MNKFGKLIIPLLFSPHSRVAWLRENEKFNYRIAISPSTPLPKMNQLFTTKTNLKNPDVNLKPFVK